MKKVSGETTLQKLQQAYLQTQMRARALRICEELDRACNYASAQAKQDALADAWLIIENAR